eukprot:10985186-Karenia_brevis.AAC.1
MAIGMNVLQPFSSHYARHMNAHSLPFLRLLLHSWRFGALSVPAQCRMGACHPGTCMMIP